jgi:hypothetical protein
MSRADSVDDVDAGGIDNWKRSFMRGALRRLSIVVGVLGSLLALTSVASAQDGQPWRNANLSPDQRAQLSSKP